jgi:hypothetical protein
MREAETLRRQGPSMKANQSCRPDFFHCHSLRATTETQFNDEINEAKPVRRVADLEAGLARYSPL